LNGCAILRPCHAATAGAPVVDDHPDARFVIRTIAADP
jgi:hypothetical protein